MKGWIITLLLVVGLPGFFAGTVFVPMALRAWHTQRVLAHGLPASAEVVALRDTGNTINNRPVYRITLKVLPPGEAGFSASVQRVFTGMDVYTFAPGSLLRVKYDPRNHARIAIIPGPG